jgi:hypothetical protein
MSQLEIRVEGNMVPAAVRVTAVSRGKARDRDDDLDPPATRSNSESDGHSGGRGGRPAPRRR